MTTTAKRSRFIRNAWLTYRTAVFPARASSTQLRETRRAFYAGAEMLLCEILISLSPGPDSTEPDEDYLTQLHDELRAFAEDVKEGRA
jgi:hypothetical protein